MADTTTFLVELARQVKRHPQSFPTWLPILADDIIETADNVKRREFVQRTEQRVFGDGEDADRYRAILSTM